MNYGDDSPAQSLDTEVRRAKGSILGSRQERIQKALETADNAVDTLNHRIDPALRPEGPHALDGASPSDPDATSELGGFLDYVERRAVSLGQRISALSERVDL